VYLSGTARLNGFSEADVLFQNSETFGLEVDRDMGNRMALVTIQPFTYSLSISGMI